MSDSIRPLCETLAITYTQAIVIEKTLKRELGKLEIEIKTKKTHENKLTKKVPALDKKYRNAIKEFNNAKKTWERTDAALHDCLMRGGSSNGECIREENAESRAINAMKKAGDTRQKASEDFRTLKKEIEQTQREIKLLNLETTDLKEDIAQNQKDKERIATLMKKYGCKTP